MVKLIAVAFLAVTLVVTVSAQTPVTPDTTGKVPAPPAAKTALSIEKMAFCTGVQEKEPVGEAAEFAAGVGTLYFWSNVLNSGPESSVKHVWYYNGAEKASVDLPARYTRNRVWSSKLVPPESTGEWKVEVIAENGEVLGTKTCVVK